MLLISLSRWLDVKKIGLSCDARPAYYKQEGLAPNGLAVLEAFGSFV